MIQLDHVTKTYAPNYRVLADINLEITKGEFVYFTGASGAGKSTLLKLLYREEEPSAGQILIDGKNVTRLGGRAVALLRRTMGLVFQEFKLLPSLTALANVALAAEVTGASKRVSRTRAYNLLRELGVKDRYDARSAALAGGEQQRVAIARALVNQPTLILADEPTGNLDSEAAAVIMRSLQQIHQRGATVVIASHDRQLIHRFAGRVVSLEGGRVAGDTKGATVAGIPA